ncbi:nuclear transport factor 2 family protein [Lewinella sp. IMCC34183]|uniref:nuclear transport factor 2 family protein n=1 Tax=Lewinella sp. IMCC34183 TaxID=2248762 RepID=UPI0018E5A5F7|nr:nuclear transport factor 2 family protein [Lewinella sp. IMCC34183]
MPTRICCAALLFCATCALPAQAPIPDYHPSDSTLYAEILAMDQRYFDAYNTCDLATQEAIYADDLEFYHDRGGLATSKPDLLRAIEQNICGKVKRFLLPETVEVHPIPGFGAVELGYHRFENAEEPEAPSVPSRFVTVWKRDGDRWLMSRVISLH